MGKLLESGQFGEVYKGILQLASPNEKVAIKTLENNANKEDRVNSCRRQPSCVSLSIPM